MPKRNILYPYIPVDEITLDDHKAVARKGSDGIRVSLNRINQPNCSAPKSNAKGEMQEFLQSEFQFGLPPLEYPSCDHHCFEREFGKHAERVKCGMRHLAPNLHW